MNRCETWTIKAEHWRIDAFKLWCWRKLLRVLWTARRSNQSILKEINPDYSLERLMLKLKLQYFGHLMRRADSLEKADWGQKEKGLIENETVGWHHWLNGHEFEQPLEDSEGQGSLACCSPWSCRVRHDWVTEQEKSVLFSGHSLTSKIKLASYKKWHETWREEDYKGKTEECKRNLLKFSREL